MKISAIQAIPVRLPREREKAVRTAGSPTALMGSGDYRWSAVFPTLYAVNFETALIKITLDSGMVGWGEAQAPLAPEVACAIVDLLLKPVLLDAGFDGSIPEIERLWDLMYSGMRVRGQTGGFMLDAISGVDLALWDLAGKIQERPVCELIPGSAKRSEVAAYYSGIPGATAGDRVENALRRREEGFRNFKIFYDCGREEFFEAFRGLRRALGDDVGLAVDALWRLSPRDAPVFGRELDEGWALWLEAPLPPEDPLAHAELARRIRTPLALGESYRTRYELAAFFRERALGFVQPDLGRCGITESLRIAAVAAEAGVPVVPHLSIAMGPQIAAAIHFAAAIPNCELLEYNPNVLEMANRFLSEPLECRGGRYSVPQRPGLGCNLTYL